MAASLRACAVALLIIAAACVVMSGCAKTATTTGIPSIAIITSEEGEETVPAGDVLIRTQVMDFNIVDKQGQAAVAGQGHVHFYMDMDPPSDTAKPAIPADPNAVWADVSGTKYTFTNVAPGRHTFAVQLVNNDHIPISPIVAHSITAIVTIPSEGPSVLIVTPRNGTTGSAGIVTVQAAATNFTVVDKQGQANVLGEGHLHFYMDVTPLPSTPGQPAIPSSPNAVWAHVPDTTYTFTNVTPGRHTFSVQLANNDHTPVIPIASDSITVTVTVTEPVAMTQPTTASSDGGSSGD